METAGRQASSVLKDRPASDAEWREWLAAAAAAGLALAVFLLFREAPELGDDLDYWGLARDLHDKVAGAWSASSFHDLRWPVWGPIWIAQAVGLTSLASYYAAPLAYFLGTALIVFLLARICHCDRSLALAAVVLYALHPYQDTVFSRPMPDLSEGFWIASALLCWMKGSRSRPMLVLGSACLAMAISNRITGALAACALGIAVLLCERHRWRELAALTGMTVGFVLIEWAFWAVMAGDFLAVWHANLGGRGRAGTGPISPLELPFRYLRYLAGPPWQLVLTALLGLGLLAGWRDSRLRLVCAMALAWWLAISCAVQGFDPLRPMLRTSGRFLAGLSPLLAVIGAGGLGVIATMFPAAMQRKAGVALFAGIVALAIVWHERTLTREKFPEEIAEILARTPAGSRVLADPPMRQLAMLCNESAARKIDWDVRKQMVVSTPELEAAASRADEIWFLRSKIWNWVLADLRSGKLRQIPRLASYLEPPFQTFWPRRVIAHGQLAEFHFLSRSRMTAAGRTIEVPGGQALPALVERKSFPKGKWNGSAIALPPGSAGTVAAVHFESSAESQEPLMAWIEFLRGGELLGRLEFEPPGFPETTANTYFFEIPPGCDSWRPRLQVRSAARVDALEVELRRPALPEL